MSIIPKSIGAYAHHALPAAMFAHGVSSSMDEGSSFAGAAVENAAEWAMWDVMYGGMGIVTGTLATLGVEALKAAPAAGVSLYESLSQQQRQMEKIERQQGPFRNYTFVDGPQIYNMRQAGLALAAQSKYKLQQTMLGNEARYMHR